MQEAKKIVSHSKNMAGIFNEIFVEKIVELDSKVEALEREDITKSIQIQKLEDDIKDLEDDNLTKSTQIQKLEDDIKDLQSQLKLVLDILYPKAE